MSDERTFRERLEDRVPWLAPDVVSEIARIHDEMTKALRERAENAKADLATAQAAGRYPHMRIQMMAEERDAALARVRELEEALRPALNLLERGCEDPSRPRALSATIEACRKVLRPAAPEEPKLCQTAVILEDYGTRIVVGPCGEPLPCHGHSPEDARDERGIEKQGRDDGEPRL